MLVEAEISPGRCRSPSSCLPAILALFYGLATALARLFWTDGIGRIAALAVGFGAGRMAAHLPVHRLSLEPDRLRGDADAAADAVGIGGRHGRHERAGRLRLPHAGAACRPTRNVRVGLAACALLLVAAHVGFGYFRLRACRTLGRSGSLPVRIVQPAIDQAEKSDGDIARRIFQHAARPVGGAAARPGGRSRQLIVWPETSRALPASPSGPMRWRRSASCCRRPDAAGRRGARGGPAAGRRTATTIPSSRSTTAARSSTRSTRCTGAVRRISAVRRTVAEQLGIEQIVAMPDGFSAGTARASARRCRRAAGCALHLLRDHLSRTRSADGVKRADFIVNVTNDAWFGDTPGPYQHFRQAQVRGRRDRPAAGARRQHRHLRRLSIARARHRCIRAQRARRDATSRSTSRRHRRCMPTIRAQRLLHLGVTCGCSAVAADFIQRLRRN